MDSGDRDRLCGALWADSQGDLDSAKPDYSSAKSKLDDVKYKVDKYLEQSRGLRSFDTEKLNSLIDQLCRPTPSRTTERSVSVKTVAA